jgi:hypothetical protein
MPLPLLLLEQILKCGPRIIRPQAGRRRRLLLPGHTNLKQLTLIPRVLLRNPLLHRLHALEPAPRIEIRALLARMQLKCALRTFLIHGQACQHRPALCAARHGACSRQIHGSRTHRMVPLRWTALAFRGRLPRFLPARLTIAVLISRLPIFRHNPSPARPVLSRRLNPARKYPQAYPSSRGSIFSAAHLSRHATCSHRAPAIVHSTTQTPRNKGTRNISRPGNPDGIG